MGYARKIPVKKMNLHNYVDFAMALWKTFLNLSKHCDRIDVIFDLYLQQSIKQDERNRQTKADPIELRISHFEQQLPIEMDRFWASPENKMRLQQMFIKSSLHWRLLLKTILASLFHLGKPILMTVCFSSQNDIWCNAFAKTKVLKHLTSSVTIFITRSHNF